MEKLAVEFEKYRDIKVFDRSCIVSLIREVRVHTGGSVEIVFDCDDEFMRLSTERQVG